jgi:hypothetical protein
MCKKLICLFSFVLVLSVAGSASAEVMAYWKFNEGSGTTVEDSSVNANDGDIENAEWVAEGKYGAALRFDGQSSRVVVADSPSLHPDTGDITIEAWIKVASDPKGWSNAGAIVFKQDSYQWCVNANGALWFGIWGARLETLGSYDFSNHLDEWHHAAIAFEGTSQRSQIYVDGELNVESTVVEAVDPTTNTLYIGYKGDGDTYFDGMIDEVRISDVVLTEDDIQVSMLGGAGFPFARTPDPADGSLLESTWANLSWRAGDYAVSHDVYLGDSLEDVNTGAEGTFQGNQTKTSLIVGFPGFAYPDGLVTGTTYYWRVDEVNDADPNSPWKGPVWSFLVPSRNAYGPEPIDGAKFVDADLTLNWKAGFNAKLHTIYFGDNFDDVNSATVGLQQAGTSYTPDALESDKTYYWRVDEFDGSIIHKGDVWTFTTMPVIEVADDPNLVAWWTFDEGMGTTALDWSGHGNHGTLFGPDWTSPGLIGETALNFGGNDYVAIQNLTYDRTDYREATVCLWIWTKIWSQQYIASFDRDQYWRLSINLNGVGPGQVGWHVRTSSGQVDYNSTRRVDDGAWHHVCGVFDNGRMTIYIDGSPEASTTGGSTFGTGNTRYGFLGANCEATSFDGNRGTGSPLAGGMDDLRIYDRALTQEEIVQVMRGDLLLAWNPSPADGSTPDIKNATPLSWSPGDNVSQHDVYFGTDKDAVGNAGTSTADIYRGRQGSTSYTPAEGVEWGGGPYYWRIDEYNTDETITKGRVWSFTVADFILVDNFEGYNAGENQIWYAWKDGLGYGVQGTDPYYPGNGTGSAVGDENTGSYTEESIVHAGRQAMPLAYDNNKQGFFKYSEAEMTLTYPRDWTENGVGVLSLWFRGNPAGFVEEPAGTYRISASGTDISDVADEFRYAYKQLSGAGSISVQVLSVENTNGWAKAGVMIRESLEAGSRHAFVCLTPSNGVAFEGRITPSATSFSTNQTGFTAPYWVKLERGADGTFTAYHSADGVSWQAIQDAVPRLISMSPNVYIGLAVTSHNSGVACTAEFSNVQTNGTVTPMMWTQEAIGVDMASNDPEPIYVALNGNAVVFNDNPSAALLDEWTEWNIDLQAFADQGVNLNNVDTIAIGLGDKTNPQAGGSGIAYFDDIRLYRPSP